MKYKVVVKCIIFFVITLILVNLNNCTNASSNDLKDNLSQFNCELYVNDEAKHLKNSIIYKYNTIFVPMDETFEVLNLSADNLPYSRYYVEPNESKPSTRIASVNPEQTKIIANVKTENGNRLDLEVEIEKENGISYIPIYLISNLKGMIVEVDGTKVYEADTEKRSKDAINFSLQSHKINIKTEQEENGQRLNNTIQDSKDDKMDDGTLAYIGEENGALWREEALKRIEKIRKKAVNIKIVDEKGNEINDASMNLKLKNTEFIHGLSISNDNTRDSNGNHTWENYYNYRNGTKLFNGDSQYSNLFNGIRGLWHTCWLRLALQGKDTDQTEGNSKNKAAIDDLLSKAEKYNLYVRAHLFYDNFYTVGDEELEQQYDNVKYQTLIGDPDHLDVKTAGGNYTMAYIYDANSRNELSESRKDELIDALIDEFESIVLEHIRLMVQKYPNINEWDCVNEPMYNSFFKHYLYDRACLTDNTFYKNLDSIMAMNKISTGMRYEERSSNNDNYIQNDRYLKFVAKCYATAKEANPNAKLVLNHNLLGISSKKDHNNIINGIKIIEEEIKKLNPNAQIDAIGIENTITPFKSGNCITKNTLYHSPIEISYNINLAAEETGIKNLVITEFWLPDKKNTGETAKREKYAYDTLISSYSNPNIYEFIYYNYLTVKNDYEKQAYERFANEYYSYEEELDYNGTIDRNLTKGTYVATVKVNGKEEKIDFTVSDETNELILVVDKTAPSVSVQYSTTEATNGNVTVTITSNEKLKEVAGWTLSEDKLKLTKVYAENKEENVTVSDLVGNTAVANVKITNIDKTAPTVSVKYSTTATTNGNVTVTITSNEKLKEVAGWTLSEDKLKLTKVYAENKEENVTVSDLAGNTAVANVKITNIDKTAPSVSVQYSTTETTNGNVTVTITSNEKLKEVAGWTISEDKLKLTKTYTANKEENVTVSDLAGNTAVANVKITNIDKDITKIGVKYRGHVQDIGWQDFVQNGATAGVEGKGLKVEALNINLINADKNAHIKYQTHVQDIGWMNYVADGAQTGTTGQNKKIEAIRIKLEGLPGYSVEYRAYANGIGWMNWVSDGILAGTTGQNRKLEAVQIRIIKTDEKQKINPGIMYRGHVQDIGWQNFVQDSTTAGVEGKGLKVEAFNINLTNVDENAHIKYQTHVQDIGWMDYVADGAQTGTTGQNKKIEAIRIKLEGLPGYSVEYRAYANGIGWMNWVSDGILAGTTGQNRKLEAIQIRLVKTENKVKVIPGVTYRGHVQDIGWQNFVETGETAGVVGKGLKVEAFNINLTNVDENAHIKYETHVQDIGWMDYVRDGAQTGTTGQNKKVEAIRIRLEGLPEYSVEYRAYVNGQGWQNWVSNGLMAGTVGQNRKLEAIQIRIVKK